MPIKIPTEQELKKDDEEYLVKHNVKVQTTAVSAAARHSLHARTHSIRMGKKNMDA